MTRAAVLALLLPLTACAAGAHAEPHGTAPNTLEPLMSANTSAKTGHAAIDGVDYYYEIHGHGAPLLVLHGAMQSIDMIRPQIDKLAASHEVIAVDLHGHGRTPLGTRAFELESIGDDMAALVKQLGHDTIDVVGYSLGGAVAFRMAAQHPDRIHRLVMISTTFSSDAFFAEQIAQRAYVTAALAPMMKDTPMYKLYAQVAPRDEFPHLLDALGEFMRTPYNWQADVAKLTMPTMIVFGDSDMIPPDHAIAFYKALGGGQKDGGPARDHMGTNRLAILPGSTHYDILDSPLLIPTIAPFLAAP